MNSVEGTGTDVVGILRYLLVFLVTLALALAPWILVAFYTKNRRMWLWWHRNGWKGTAAISVLASIFRIPIVMNRFALDGPQLFLFPDLSLTAALARVFNPVFASQNYRFITFQLLLIELLVLFPLFSLLKMSKTYFAKRAYEIE